MSTPAALKIQNLEFGFKGKSLFKNLNLEIKMGQFVSIMGENGSGKSTLLKILLGLIQPKEGKIQYWGNTLAPPNRKGIMAKTGWVFSEPEDYPLGLSIGRYFEAISGAYPRWNKLLQTELTSQFQLNTSKDLRSLSLGEHSKVRLTQALSQEPELLILDELTANLSPESKKVVVSTLLNSFSKNPMAVLYICHFREEAVRLSDGIYKLTAEGLVSS